MEGRLLRRRRGHRRRRLPPLDRERAGRPAPPAQRRDAATDRRRRDSGRLGGGMLAGAERWAAALRFDETAHLRLIEALEDERPRGRRGDGALRRSPRESARRSTSSHRPSSCDSVAGLAEDVRAEIARRGRGSAAVHAPQFVGRGPEFGELADAWQTVSDGDAGRRARQGEAGQRAHAAVRGAHRAPRHHRPWCCARAEQATLRRTRRRRSCSRASAMREGSAGASPEALAEVARMVPSLTLEFRHLPPATRRRERAARWARADARGDRRGAAGRSCSSTTRMRPTRRRRQLVGIAGVATDRSRAARGHGR